MKDKSSMERYLAEQAHFFEQEEIRLREQMAKQTERELQELLAKEGEAYKRLVQNTRELFIRERNIDKGIAKELAEHFILKSLREHIQKKRDSKE